MDDYTAKYDYFHHRILIAKLDKTNQFWDEGFNIWNSKIIKEYQEQKSMVKLANQITINQTVTINIPHPKKFLFLMINKDSFRIQYNQ